MTNFSVGRREFVSLLGCATVWPLAARAQALPVVGFLNSTSPDPTLQRVAAFRQGLNEFGYMGGQNVAIEFRWAENQSYRLQNLVGDLVRRRVAPPRPWRQSRQPERSRLSLRSAATRSPTVWSTISTNLAAT